MRYQGLWLCLAAALAPALSLGDDDGPVSALIVPAAEQDQIAEATESQGGAATGDATLVIKTEPDGKGTATIESVELELVANVAVSKYWLGLDCEPIEDALRAQLDLP